MYVVTMMNTWQTLIAAVAAVIVVALVVAGIVFATEQGTERRKTCVQNSGSWYDGHCLILRPGTAQ